MGGGGVLVLVIEELALDPKIDVSHRFHFESREPTETNIYPTEWRYFLTECLRIWQKLYSRSPVRSQCANIWSMGTRSRTSDILERTLSQDAKSVHFP